MSAGNVSVGALCAGYGGLELGLELAGVPIEHVWHSDTSAAANVVLERNWGTPNLGDLRDIHDPPQVDIVTAGFPCQPVSVAGNRNGINDERWLIDDVVRIWRASGATWLLLENTTGILTANGGQAFGAVIEALAQAGATARWTCLRAAHVGAAHRRERWFCLATNADSEPARGFPRATLGQKAPWQDEPQEPDHHRPQNEGAGADAWEEFWPAISRWGRVIGRPSPWPLIGDDALNPRFVEWHMGLPEGWVTSVNLSARQQLKLLGNGVVPAQAAAAINALEVI